MKQIGAGEPLALPRLDQRSSDPAVAQLFRIPTREFLEACIVNEGWDYALVCLDPTLTLTVYGQAFEREPVLEWIGEDGLGRNGRWWSGCRRCSSRLRAEEIPLFDDAESCAVLQRAQAAARDRALEHALDALARDARCAARRAT